jgi:hypothetical protein
MHHRRDSPKGCHFSWIGSRFGANVMAILSVTVSSVFALVTRWIPCTHPQGEVSAGKTRFSK